MSAPASSRWDHEARLLAWLAACVSVFSFLFYFRHGDVLLYGDAVAHINIARRVFDSKTPGLLQLGTVWLPLPHLLMIPFLVSDDMWRRGAGGSIPSLVSYVFAVVGMFRLMRGVLSRAGEPEIAAKVAAWSAAVVLGANPNLIYMQTTAMGESLYLAFFIWVVVYFSEFTRGDAKALTKCGLCLAAACFTRYDGWFLAGGMIVGVLIVGAGSRKMRPIRALYRETHDTLDRQGLSPHNLQMARFALIALAAPALWLSYNAVVYRNPLEFANGPYSAKAIEQRTSSPGNVGHPGSGNLYVAGLYFAKAAQANMAENVWLQRLWILLGITSFVLFAVNPHFRKEGADGAPMFLSWLPLVFLLIPLPFYALSVAYGGVPIFVPAWWPFTHYNVRYGLQFLPAFAAAFALLVYLIVRSGQWNGKVRRVAMTGMIVVVIASYGSIWRADPICLSEAVINMRSRNALEKQLAGWLKALPPNSTLLMYLGDHVGALQQAGIPLHRVINEGNHRVWMHPADSDGLWERALAHPSQLADYVVAFEGDQVWQAMQGRHARELVEINVTGQARAILYRLR